MLTRWHKKPSVWSSFSTLAWVHFVFVCTDVLENTYDNVSHMANSLLSYHRGGQTVPLLGLEQTHSNLLLTHSFPQWGRWTPCFRHRNMSIYAQSQFMTSLHDLVEMFWRLYMRVLKKSSPPLATWLVEQMGNGYLQLNILNINWHLH